MIRELKERPNEKPIVGDLVCLRKRNSIYKPARLIKIEEVSRYRVYGTIRWKNYSHRYHKNGFPELRCSYYDLVVLRKDTFTEILIGKFKGIKGWLKSKRKSKQII